MDDTNATTDALDGSGAPEERLQPAQRHKGSSVSLKEIVRILLLAGIFLAILLTGRSLLKDNGAAFQQWVRQWGHGGWAAFTLAGAALISVGLPRTVICLAAGALFDFALGVVLAQTATALSSAAGYYYARLIGRGSAVRRMGRRMTLFDNLLRTHGFMVFLLIRLCPIGNTLLTNALAGVSSVRFWSYFAASFLGFLPLTVICTLMGCGFTDTYHLKIWIGAGSFAAFSIFFLWYSKQSSLARHILRILRSQS